MSTPSLSVDRHPPSPWKLGGLAPSQLARSVFAEVGAHNLLGRASELAFEFLFALFPLILLMVTVFGLFASRSAELQTAFLSYFADFLPPAAFQLLGTTASELAVHASGGKLTFGAVAALWCASGGVGSIISALNSAYHVRETRSWFKVRAIAVWLTLVISILLLTALFIVLVSGRVVDWLGVEFRLQSSTILLWKAVQWPAAVLFVILSYSVIYYWGPDLPERRWYWVTPGSAFGASLWLVASLGFRLYLRFFNSYSATYGSLGAVMILMLWLYVTGLAFLIGGQINAEIERATPDGGAKPVPAA
jgi:membrane protein